MLTAHTMFPAVLSGFLASCTNTGKKEHACEFFTAAEVDTIIETIDLILPATRTLSASQVNTHVFLDQVFAKCMTDEQQAIIREGLDKLKQGLASATDKMSWLAEIDKKAYHGNEDCVYFKTIKQYAMIGFFTSQEGTTKASNYVKIPAAYEGEIPATENTLNYGRTSLKFYL
ncbi:MAG: gluconate 2-dehydrogenase subunit 3 family protein [Bacteroidota bacterium]|nr:gluconate 2-dehydrogenase subunit 3 family protein [Bacteroidota bacterium]